MAGIRENRERRKPWPDWARRYYWLIRAHAGKLEQMVRWLLKYGVERRNAPRLEKFIPQIENVALAIDLYCRECQEQRGGERWPYWANQAVETALEQAGIAVQKAAQAGRYLERGYWEMMERRLTDCLTAAQKVRQALMEGPPPSIEEADMFVFLNEAEAIAGKRWLEQLLEGGQDVMVVEASTTTEVTEVGDEQDENGPRCEARGHPRPPGTGST